MRCQTIRDNLKLYNKYTNDYRMPGSKRYGDFTEQSPYVVDDILGFAKNFAWEGKRDELCSVLHKYAAIIEAGHETVENIDKLSQKKTLAIVTGHQPALFGGALFVLLKIASTIALVNKLNQQNSEYEFVPVFWNASEDHNVSEFNSLSIYDKANDLKTIGLQGFDQRLMAGDIHGAVTQELIDQLIEALPQTEFLAEIRADILSSNFGSLGENFSRLINRWFGRFGLIIIEPEYLRALAAPLISTALSRHCELVKNMQHDSIDMLKAGYSLQLPDASEENSFVFYLKDGIRYRLKTDGKKFVLPELGLAYTIDEILQKVASEAENFSPVAGLRPIIQASIFPALVYVAGGGELAYHYQLRRNFTALGQRVPLLLPRLAGTFITPSINKLLSTFSIDYNSILSEEFEWENVERRLLESNSALNSAFTEYAAGLSSLNERLFSELQALGISGEKELTREQEKFSSRMDNIYKRFADSNSFGGEGAKSRFFKLKKFILPGKRYQELNIAGIYFYSLLGKQFFDTICDIDLLNSDHKLWIF